MVQLTRSERAAISELLSCVAEAIHRHDEVDPSYANKTKLQKLLYLSIDEFDLPITHSWYLAGAVVPTETATPAELRTAFDRLANTDGPGVDATGDTDAAEMDSGSATSWPQASPASPTEELVGADEVDDDIKHPDTGADVDTTAKSTEEDTIDPILFSVAPSDPDDSTDDGPLTIIHDRRDNIIDFYESILPEVWKQNTMRFLQNFYLEHAPEAYGDFYVQSTHLRTRLRDIELTIEAHINGNQPNQSIPELVNQAGLDISDLHYTVRSSETLATTFNLVVRGTDLIEDGLMMLEQRTPEELNRDDLAVVQSMQEFFYYYVWRYPCLIISRETATGPGADALREQRQHRLNTFEKKLEREIDRFEEELKTAGLLPDHTDYPSREDEIEQMISGLSKQYME